MKEKNLCPDRKARIHGEREILTKGGHCLRSHTYAEEKTLHLQLSGRQLGVSEPPLCRSDAGLHGVNGEGKDPPQFLHVA
jgi:hypothetical protein